jgi:NADH:ubiquinone oxidoreductase subunit 6 (subunit J)
MGPAEGAIVFSGTITIIAAIAAILLKNLIHAVIAFAVSSATLACLFFILASPYAGVFELTVGAGLVAVLFLVVMILAGGWDGEASA